jgi:hypothetical protein
MDQSFKKKKGKKKKKTTSAASGGTKFSKIGSRSPNANRSKTKN